MVASILEMPSAPAAAHPNSLNVEAAKKFIFSGRAKFTLLNPQTNKHFTFKVRAPKKQGAFPCHFVEVLNGPDSFKFFGTVFQKTNFRFSQKAVATGIGPTAPSVQAFEWLMAALAKGDLRYVQVLHSGRCGRCGRELTDPVSIARGLGPECAGKEG